jgi:hypothetical protein
VPRRRLFRGLPEEVAERIVEGDIPAPTFVKAEFPPALEAIIMKALEVDPAERYQNCDHMFRDLEKFTEQAGIRCTPRMISAYMSEMFGEGAPAEVNYDDQYDDLVDEALDFDKFDALEAAKNDDAPEWAKSIESSADTSGVRNKKSMTIGNLEALLGPEFQQLRQQRQASAAPAAGPARGGESEAAGSGRAARRPARASASSCRASSPTRRATRKPPATRAPAAQRARQPQAELDPARPRPDRGPSGDPPRPVDDHRRALLARHRRHRRQLRPRRDGRAEPRRAARPSPGCSSSSASAASDTSPTPSSR